MEAGEFQISISLIENGVVPTRLRVWKTQKRPQDVLKVMVQVSLPEVMRGAFNGTTIALNECSSVGMGLVIRKDDTGDGWISFTGARDPRFLRPGLLRRGAGLDQGHVW